MLTDTDILSKFRLDGKTALVAGIGPGVGAHVAQAYAAVGANVVLVARSKDKVDALAAEITAAGGSAVGVQCDVGVKEDLERMVDTARSTYGHIDISFYNAFTAPINDSMFDDSDEDWQNCFNVNMLAPYRLAKMLVPAMKKKGSGSIIHVLSTSGFLVLPPLVSYGCTKAGLTHLTRYLAKECAPEVRVNSLCVGTTTPEGSPAADATGPIRGTIPGVPLQRVGAGKDHIGAALLLASEASAYTTGQVLFTEGGRVNTMGGPSYNTPDGQPPVRK
jgi:NAD(P)-dependent dehydrogenase (short-subunit alcohol dehydrogenase family)